MVSQAKQSRDGIDHYKMYVGGEWVESTSGEEVEVENPSSEEIIGAVQAGNKEDAVRALESATKAQPAWAALPAVERGNCLFALAAKLLENRDRLAKLLVREQGKPLWLGKAEVADAADFLNFAGQAARRLEGDIYPSDRASEQIWIQKVPYGAAVGLAGYNFPLALATRKLGPALVTGNTMVVKPPTVTPMTVVELAELAHEVGFPPGVVNVVTGTDSSIGRELVINPMSKLVTMTGSTETGQEVFRAAADDLKAVRLELGGKAPFIVMEDADLDLAAQVATNSRFINAGQVCTCNERMYVHERVYSEFMEKFLERVKKVRVGDPMTNVDFGPKVSAEELRKVDSMVQQAIKDGCELALGGKRPSGSSFDKGHWYEPTVLLNAKNNMRIMQEEIFGPVAPVMEVGSFEEALSLANDSRYGLSAFVFTNDVRRVMRLVNELDFGEIYVNRPMGEQRQGFHNGWKMSGTGGEDGKYGIENYLQKKSMYVDYSGGGDG